MRTFVLYAVVVGIPVAGTSLVLESGRHLQAPPAVGGTWAIEVARDASQPGCRSAAGASESTILTIGQSGDSLTIALDSTARPIVGRLASFDPPVITTPSSLGKTSPVEGALVGLQAAVKRTSTPMAMEGTLTTIVCGGLKSDTFRASWRAETAHRAESH